MARRGKSRKRESEGPPEDWRAVLPVGALLGAVLITLVLGAVLRTGPSAPASAAGLPATATPSLPATDAATPAPAVEPAPPGLDLAQRAARDARRIRSDPAGWTLQFMLACDPVNIRPRVEALADRTDFFLLPKEHDGQSCFRLCWGRFGSRQQALASTGYPHVLNEITRKPQALQIAKALP